jgi:hypothetical protein
MRGLDPRIHADKKLFSPHRQKFSMDHWIKPGAEEESACGYALN